jgi:hypothetical protein
MAQNFLGADEIIKHATEYYRSLFGQALITDLRLEGIEGEQLTDDVREALMKEFGLEEIKEVVFELKHNKAAGPDGLPVDTLQTYL